MEEPSSGLSCKKWQRSKREKCGLRLPEVAANLQQEDVKNSEKDIKKKEEATIKHAETRWEQLKCNHVDCARKLDFTRHVVNVVNRVQRPR